MDIKRFDGAGRTSRAVEHNDTIYLKDMAHFEAMNEVRGAWVVDGFEPARACVEARMARDTLLVEMSVNTAKAWLSRDIPPLGRTEQSAMDRQP